jgi:transposase
MRQFEFTDEELKTISHERFYHPHPRVLQRMEILWLKAHNEKHERIAVLADVSRRTVQRVLDAYEQEGLEGVRTFHAHVPQSALTPHQTTLEAEFTARPPHTVGEACERIAQLTGIERKREQVRCFLRNQLGLRWRKTAAIPVPPKKSVEEHAAVQAAFLKDGP